MDDMNKKNYEIKDQHQELTNRMISTLEESINSGWVKPWFTCNELPFNPVTGTKYKGINACSLMTAGFSDPRFFTFKNVGEYAQDNDLKLSVRKGSKGFPVFKAVQIVVAGDSEEGEEQGLKSGEVKSFYRQVYAGTVFNGSQIEGLEPYVKLSNVVEDHHNIDLFTEALKSRTGLTVNHSEMGRAYYQMGSHSIHMPNKELFTSTDAYYSTLLHEETHASGKALNRDMGGMFGSKSYAFEELVAELGSYFLGAELGLPYNPSGHENHAAYLESWLGMLKSDKNVIFKAASAGSRATEFNMDHFNEFKKSLEKTLAIEQKIEPSKQKTQTVVMSM